jgi:putative ABC transport system substrate-binding protein
MLALAAGLLTAAAWPVDSAAQRHIARVGVLSWDSLTNDPTTDVWWEPFRRTLAVQGWVEGNDVVFEHRSARADPSRFAEAAAELTRLKVDVIYAVNAPALRAAHAATRTIPIVGQDFTTDPVAAGYAESISRPAGNLTGVFLDAPEFSGKWLELLKSILPDLSRVAVLWDPSPGDTHLRALQGAARSAGIQLQVVEVHKPEDIDRAAAAFRGRPQALIVLPSPMMYVAAARVAGLATKQRLLATSMARSFAEAGGVLAYGPDITLTNARCAVLVGKVLGGAKPAEIPIEKPTKFDLVVNLKAAKALNLKIPDSVLARADRVIRE